MYKIVIKKGEIGFYDNIEIESGSKIKVFGQYDVSKVGGGGDAIHSFHSRSSDSFGGRMNDAVMESMIKFYNSGYNPSVLSIDIKYEKPFVKWEVIIGESVDGKAYTGFNSRGGAAGNETKEQLFKRVDHQINDKKKKLPGEVNEPNLEFKDIYDFYNPSISGKSGIRQLFFQYTKPKKYPNLPKSNKTPNIKSQEEVSVSQSNKIEEDKEYVFNVVKDNSFVIKEYNTEFVLYTEPLVYDIEDVNNYSDEDFDEYTETGFLGDEEDYISYEAAESISLGSDKEQSNFVNTLDSTPYDESNQYKPGKYELDLIPGEYVNNNGSKIKLCAIDGKPVNTKIADNLMDMKKAASDDGLKIILSSGFRSPYDRIDTKSSKGVKVQAQSQKELYDLYKSGKGNLAAEPGKSNHGNGISLDIAVGTRKKGTLNDKLYVWLIKNSWKFGFVRSVYNEEWHFDYRPDLIESKDKGKPYARLEGKNSNLFFTDLGLDKLG
jgi:hypothetical protein